MNGHQETEKPRATRIPGSVASFRVQLPSATANPSSLPQTTTTTQTHLSEYLATSTSSQTSIEPTDLQLLTSSILSNQARQRIILEWQEKLIWPPSSDPLESIPSKDLLKQALIYLSPLNWMQVVQERFLSSKCGYPRCLNSAPIIDSKGKYRISMKSRKITLLDKDQEEAGRSVFCSDWCFLASEWIRTWILKDSDHHHHPSSSMSMGRKSTDPNKLIAGKWQKMVEEVEWKKIELLEEVQDFTGLTMDSLDTVVINQQDDETVDKPLTNGLESLKSSMVLPLQQSKKKEQNVEQLMNSLTIIEKKVPSTFNSKQTSTSSTTTTTTTDRSSRDNSSKDQVVNWSVDVPNSLGTSLVKTQTDNDKDNHEEEEENDLELDLSEWVVTPRSKQQQHQKEDEEEDDEDDEPIDPKLLAERSETMRLMDQALEVRQEQRRLGLLS